MYLTVRPKVTSFLGFFLRICLCFMFLLFLELLELLLDDLDGALLLCLLGLDLHPGRHLPHAALTPHSTGT